MARYLISYTDPETGEPATVVHEFHDWTGHAQNAFGEEFGPAMTITAREWAEDCGYSLADKGAYTVTELP